MKTRSETIGTADQSGSLTVVGSVGLSVTVGRQVLQDWEFNVVRESTNHVFLGIEATTSKGICIALLSTDIHVVDIQEGPVRPPAPNRTSRTYSMSSLTFSCLADASTLSP